MKINYLLIASVILLLLSFLFKTVSENRLQETRDDIASKRDRISKIKELKSSWSSKKIEKKLRYIQNYIPNRADMNFQNKKLRAKISSLKPSVYNRVMKDIWNTKVKIIKFKSRIVDEKYEVELECSW